MKLLYPESKRILDYTYNSSLTVILISLYIVDKDHYHYGSLHCFPCNQQKTIVSTCHNNIIP